MREQLTPQPPCLDARGVEIKVGSLIAYGSRAGNTGSISVKYVDEVVYIDSVWWSSRITGVETAKRHNFKMRCHNEQRVDKGRRTWIYYPDRAVVIA